MAQILSSDVMAAMTLNFAAKRPLKINSGPGQSKTMQAYQYARKQGPGYGLFELNCALANVPDVTGYLMTKEERHVTFDGEPINIINSHYAYPYFYRDVFTGKIAAEFDRGMLLLEEWGQAQPDVKRSLAMLIRHLRSGTHHLPANTDVLILSNRDQDRSGKTKEFDFLINSWTELEMVPTLDGWLVWAADNDVTDMTQAFAAHNETMVFATAVPEKQGPWITPRSLVACDNQVKAAIQAGYQLDDPFVRQNIAGTIGDGSAHAYIAFAAIRDKLPRLAQIIADPSNAPLPIELDQRMFLVYHLAAKAKRENFGSLITYIKRMQANFAVAFIRAAGRKDKSLVSTLEFTNWAVENQQLMAAVHSK